MVYVTYIAFASETAFWLSTTWLPVPVELKLKPYNFWARTPTRGLVKEEEKDSQKRSSANILVRDFSGTISANIGLQHEKKRKTISQISCWFVSLYGAIWFDAT
jgi:hypothetical protein